MRRWAIRPTKHGRIWACAGKPKRKRYCAWFERGFEIQVKYFPTVFSAKDWLLVMEGKR